MPPTPGVIIEDWFSPAKTFTTFGDLVTVLLKNVFVLAGVLLFILLIVGGLQFIIGGESGDKEGVGKGKNAITAALLGFILIFAAYWLVQIIEFMTGVQIFNPGI